MLHDQGDPQLVRVQFDTDLLGGLADHRLADVLAVLHVSGRAVEQPVRVSRTGAAGEQDVGAATEDQMHIDDLGVPVRRFGARQQGVAVVVDALAPQVRVVGEPLVVDALGERGKETGQLLGGETHPAPHPFDHQQPPAGPQQCEPVAQGRRGVGQQPHHMTDHDHVELLLSDGRSGRIPDQHLGTRPDELGPRLLDHARRPVDGGDAVPLPGDEQGQASGAASQVEHIGALAGQPALQPLRPCVPDHRIEQPVVGLLVEGVGGGVPVDRRHAPIVPATTDTVDQQTDRSRWRKGRHAVAARRSTGSPPGGGTERSGGAGVADGRVKSRSLRKRQNIQTQERS